MPHRLDQRGWWNDELPRAEVEPSTGRSNHRGTFAGRRPDLVFDHEARAVGAEAERGMRHRDRIVQSNLAEVLELLLANHRADSEPPELTRRKPVLGEER